MKRRLIGWLIAATMSYWVMTTRGEKFDGPFRYSGECLDAANAYLRRGYDVSYFCRWFGD